MGRRIPIRVKVAAALAVPLLALVAGAAVGVSTSTSEARKVTRQAELATASIGHAGLINVLQNERNAALVQMLDCIPPEGTTSYANAIAEAQHELNEHGRGDVQDVIVFLSDGAANTTPRRVPPIVDTPEDRARPCGSGIRVADDVKASGTVIYTIGYDLNGLGTDYERC